MTPTATIMRTPPVIPVLLVDDAADAQPIVEALLAGGLRVLEVTLRTPAALEVIREMRKFTGAIVGAGTVRDIADLCASIGAGPGKPVSAMPILSCGRDFRDNLARLAGSRRGVVRWRQLAGWQGPAGRRRDQGGVQST